MAAQLSLLMTCLLQRHSLECAWAALTDHDWVVNKQQECISHCARGSEAQDEGQRGRVLVSALLRFTHGGFTPCPHVVQGERNPSGVSSIRAMIRAQRPSHDTVPSQRPHLLIPPPLGIRIPHLNLGGHIQCLAQSSASPC